MKTRIREFIAKKQAEEARHGRFLNVATIAKEAGVNRATIKAWIDGTVDRFDGDTITKLCKYFECDMPDLLYIDWETAQ